MGPIDGHDVDGLIAALEEIRDDEDGGPVLLHIATEKGHGYAPAAGSSDKGHAVGKFDIATGKSGGVQEQPADLHDGVRAGTDPPGGDRSARSSRSRRRCRRAPGLDLFEKRFPDRTFDVGIAEQHAVTFAAGMATEGYKPFCTIYSTFLQRAYDQVVHDVVIQKLPVRFAMDRAGLVGADGCTHAGSFDLAYLGCLPGMVVMAAADEAD